MITHAPSTEPTPPYSRWRQALLASLAAAFACLACGGLLASTASAATFGITSFNTSITNQEGTPATLAGSHPYEMTTSVAFPTEEDSIGLTAATANVKDIEVALPPGLIGNPNAIPKCTIPQLDGSAAFNECPEASQVGLLTLNSSTKAGAPLPVYNLVPPAGEPAQFGANVGGVANALLNFSVRSGSDYGITSTTLDIPTVFAIVGVNLTLWGVPADPSHDDQRCEAPDPETGICDGTEPARAPHQSGGPEIPLLTMPTSCDGPLTATLIADSWQTKGDFVNASSTLPAITGCDRLQFEPSISIQPTTTSADSPSGLSVDLSMPQEGLSNLTGFAEADLKDAKVVLPAGVTVNPSSASGMVGCPLLTGKEAAQEEEEAAGVISGINLHSKYPANCPNASKIGSVKIKTPLLEEELEGGVYVAQQNANPFKSLLALYIAAEAPERGVVIKVAGHVELNEKTGQLTTTFEENPQLPFERLKLTFFEGERAALATPRTCGSYQPASLLEPWSHHGVEGEEGTPDAEPLIQSFAITSGPGGASCGVPAFAPSFEAGTANNQAGGYGSFVMNLKREDGEQRLSTVSMTMPKGLAGMLSTVKLCGEAQANAGTCAAASKIGHVVVQAGVGSEPVTLPQAGKGEDPVYITEKYGGAPFGLSIVVPAEAGPFDLGTVVVRAKVEVNPHTAQVSVVSNPMPQMLQGIPLDVQAIQVDVDRPGFMFNPTSCTPMSVYGTIGSAEGTSQAVSSRFQAAGCAALPFKPTFKAETHAFHSRKHGAYLHVHIGSAFGQANIAKVHVEVPAKLPARNDTLKLACTEAQFDKDPEGCPEGSIIGHAIAHTPILPVPLEGNVMFVSHGSRGFPDVEIVLKGDGVTEILEGQTFIDKKGQTFSTFATVPDVPVTSFDLYLPTGPHSALAGNGNLCRHVVAKREKVRLYVKRHVEHGKRVKGHYAYRMHEVKSSVPVRLQMPIEITGQNGAVVKQDTNVAVQGCKPQISVVKRTAHGDSARIVVIVPSAGKMIADGKSIARVVEEVKHAGKAQIEVHLDDHDRELLRRHPHRRLQVKVHMRFEPSDGHPLESDVTVLIP